MSDKLSFHFLSKIWKRRSFQWILGESKLGTSHLASRWIFLRILGVTYLVAFFSLEFQLKGLIGSGGILPAREFLTAVNRVLGPERFRLFPTIFWWNSSDAFLQIACYSGIVFSWALTAGIAPLLCLIVLWILYLSFTVVGQAFFSFQWDVLLLEVGFLAIFFAPMNLCPRFSRETAISPLMLLLLWWVLFRLILESGIVKLTSGDMTWRGWYMHQLPLSFQKLSTFSALACELLALLLLLGTRRFKLIGCSAIVLLQLMRGSPPVLDLLAGNPFPDHPPRYLRVLQYEYHFTNLKTRAKTGQWWWREPRRVVYPPMVLAKKESVTGIP
jgi:hypothetical protein